MEWNVYYSNNGKIDTFNVFDHWRFLEEIEDLKQKLDSKEEFSEEVRHSAMYYFWSKCEYEILLNDWINPKEEKKIDVYEQLKLNWDRFIDYVWSF